MTKHERMIKARQALMEMEEALIDLLTEHEAKGEKGMHPSKIAQELDLLLPEKGETYGSARYRYNLIWGLLDHLSTKGIICHSDSGAQLADDYWAIPL
ncbi:MAG: hypothetical protein OXK78_07845 [Caldilineaceae bacterium]|nr:hypothetical protein [Caldilineaceae bacterium]